MEDDSTDIVDMLILSGAIEVSGIDPSNGEFLYTMSPKMAEIMPDVYEEHLTEVNRGIMALWEKGFLDVEVLQENPTVRLTDKAFDEEALLNMSQEDFNNLKEIKRILVN